MNETALIGSSIDAIPTPALVVDLDRLEQNLRRMADYFAARSAKLRPHFKSHKCVELARRQLAAGSCTGITCAKLSEAEQLAAGNVTDILIANQVVGPDKARRLATLNRSATVRSAVDSLANARELSAAATEAGVCIPVLVEVDIGMKRCGVPAGAPALDLAREIGRLPGLRFDGLQGYEGHLVSLPNYEERAQKTRDAFATLVETRRMTQQANNGKPLTRVRGALYRNGSGGIVGIAYAMGSKNTWFLGLPAGEFKEAVLLCEATGNKVQAIHLPQSFIERFGKRLPVSSQFNQAKFNVLHRAGRYYLALKGSGDEDLSDYVVGQPFICPRTEYVV